MDAIQLVEIDTLRKFNRFYTSFLGILRQSYLQSGFSLAEVRVLYEIASAPGCAASDVMAVTGLDRGYLSRILTRLGREKLVEKMAARSDARIKRLSLTAKGRMILDDLTEKARSRARGTLEGLSAQKRAKLIAAMLAIMDILPDATQSALENAREDAPEELPRP